MKLFYAPGACSLASHIALAEADVEFELIKVDFSSSQQRTEGFLAMNPKGRVPVLVDGDEIITESPAILRYIARKYPDAGLWPEDIMEDARCAEWLSWCVSGIHVAFAHIARSYRYASSAEAMAEVEEKGRETVLDLWQQVESRMAKRGTTWAASERFSVADPYIFTFWNWGRSPKLGYDMSRDFPAWTEHARRLCDRPGAKRALDREQIDYA